MGCTASPSQLLCRNSSLARLCRGGDRGVAGKFKMGDAIPVDQDAAAFSGEKDRLHTILDDRVLKELAVSEKSLIACSHDIHGRTARVQFLVHEDRVVGPLGHGIPAKEPSIFAAGIRGTTGLGDRHFDVGLEGVAPHEVIFDRVVILRMVGRQTVHRVGLRLLAEKCQEGAAQE